MVTKSFVIPANVEDAPQGAGIPFLLVIMDPRFRGDDNEV